MTWKLTYMSVSMVASKNGLQISFQSFYSSITQPRTQGLIFAPMTPWVRGWEKPRQWLLRIDQAWGLYEWNIVQKQTSDISLVQTEQARFYWNIINKSKGTRTYNSVVISYKFSTPTSPCMVTFPFLIVRNTFSLHIMSKFLFFIRYKQGFFKFPAPWESNTGNIRPLMNQSNSRISVFEPFAATAMQ